MKEEKDKEASGARNDYQEVRIDVELSPTEPELEMATVTDILAAMLADAGYESFVPDRQGLTAYIRDEQFDLQALRQTLDAFPLYGPRFSGGWKRVEGRDWNEEWEKNYFQPIVVGNRCVIHSSFHKNVPPCEFDIVIDPKMAFGTGHHATTSQMIEQLLKADAEGKRVVDMGTGSGILAILAAMLGARRVDAIEIDPVAAENARQNVALNGHPEIAVTTGDASALKRLPEKANIFLANINRNIITADLTVYTEAMAPGGLLLLSGFYEKDIPVIMEVASPLGLKEDGHTVKGDNWACLRLRK